MRKPSIAASRNKFKKVLSQYVKHQGLDLEVTMKSGEKVTLSKMRRSKAITWFLPPRAVFSQPWQSGIFSTLKYLLTETLWVSVNQLVF